MQRNVIPFSFASELLFFIGTTALWDRYPDRAVFTIISLYSQDMKSCGDIRPWVSAIAIGNQDEDIRSYVSAIVKYYTSMALMTSFLASFLVPSKPCIPPTVVYFIT